jgi:hypothetical protein
MVSTDPGKNEIESLNSGGRSALHDEKDGVDLADGASKSPHTGGKFGWLDIVFSIVISMFVGLYGAELLRWIIWFLIPPRVFSSLLDRPCEKIVSTICPMTLESCKGKCTF